MHPLSNLRPLRWLPSSYISRLCTSSVLKILGRSSIALLPAQATKAPCCDMLRGVEKSTTFWTWGSKQEARSKKQHHMKHQQKALDGTQLQSRYIFLANAKGQINRTLIPIPKHHIPVSSTHPLVTRKWPSNSRAWNIHLSASTEWNG